MQDLKKYETINIKVYLTKEDKDKAKRIAKSKGMTFQGFVGRLIEGEIASNSFGGFRESRV